MLTKRIIDQTEYVGENRSRHVVWDRDVVGLGLRVYPANKGERSRKAFVLSYRAGSRKRLLTLGDYGGSLTLDEARRIARKRLFQVEHEGRDPVAERRQDRAAQTVSELITLYIEQYAKTRKRSWAEDERVLLKDVQPRIGHLKLGDVKRADIIDIIDRIRERGPVTAARTFEVTRKMFNIAIERGLIEHSPCFRISSPAKAKSRERVLTPIEIRKLVHHLDDPALLDKDALPIGISPSLRLGLKVLLLTAQRRAELAKAEWAHLNLDDGVWSIPGVNTKNTRAHRVPLSAPAVDAFRELEKLADDSAFVLPSPRGDAPIDPHALTRAFSRLREPIALNDATVHDLRRTAASGLGQLHIPRLVISKILNHADSSITAIYERFEYAKDMRRALDRWGRMVCDIVAGVDRDNVVRLGSRR